MYNFDKIIDRKNTNSIKYDSSKEIFGQEEVLPLWVADMDFQSPKAIIDAIKERAEHGVFGYTYRDNQSVVAFISWVQRRYGWDISPSQVSGSPGIVTALAIAVRTFTSAGDKILIQTPVYPPFFSVIKGNEREVVTSRLLLQDGEYKVNWQEFEQRIGSGVKMFILCNSHNPLGKLWSKKELEMMGEICLKNNVLIFSDEIHADLALNGNQHVVMASVSKEIGQNTITAMAPSKTFNIAGLLNSVIVSESPKLLSRFNKEIDNLHLGLGNLFGHITMEPAYREGEEWLQAVTEYISANADFAFDYLKRELPSVTFVKPQSSFLLWLDFNATELTHEQIRDKLANEAKVGLNDGTTFGDCGRGFFRMNIGTRRAILKEALERIVATFK